jgi:anti-sigma factor RsiW
VRIITCREVAAFIMDYVSGELAGDSLALFEYHMSLCPNCRTYLEQYRRSIELGRRAFDDPDAAATNSMPEELVDAILAARSR